MIRLTDRLQVLADQIEQNETMADIGTDHGFLPLALWERGISPKVIMVDLSPGSLNKARENANSLYPDEAFDLRLGSGIQVLKKSEVDAVVIAGMGGVLITEILAADMNKTCSFPKFVLQPRNGQSKLRFWLIHNGFSIVEENLVRERKYICPIITAVPGRLSGSRTSLSEHIPDCGPDGIELEVPLWIKEAGGPVLEFLEQKIHIEECVLRGISRQKISDKRREEKVKERITYLKSLKEGV